MEENDRRHIQRTTAQARQAVIVKPMRYVLGFGIFGVVAGFLIAWMLIRY